MAVPPRYKFGTVQMSCVDLRSALDHFFNALKTRQGGYIACTCTHGIVEAETDERLRRILNGSLMTLPDGMPTVWMGRLRGVPVRRVTAPDFMEAAINDRRARGARHFFYGAAPATVGRIAERAAAIVGESAIAGSYSPPLRAAGTPEEPDVIARIAAADPDVIWVGLGLPKQEYWMDWHRRHFPNAVLVGVGAAFDWYAGDKPRAPSWMQSLGLEWLHRMASEPRRLWPRYRTVVPLALGVMARDLLRPQQP